MKHSVYGCHYTALHILDAILHTVGHHSTLYTGCQITYISRAPVYTAFIWVPLYRVIYTGRHITYSRAPLYIIHWVPNYIYIPGASLHRNYRGATIPCYIYRAPHYTKVGCHSTLYIGCQTTYISRAPLYSIYPPVHSTSLRRCHILGMSRGDLQRS